MLYLQCKKAFWLSYHKPDCYPEDEMTPFDEKLAKDGYQVEEYAQKIFPKGIDVPEGSSGVEETKKLMKKGNVLFQPSFLTDDGFFARCDIVACNDDDTVDIFEVKSSTKVKKSENVTPKDANHLIDLCFQKIVLESCGYRVRKTILIHVNSEYIYKGIIGPSAFLTEVSLDENLAKDGEIYSSTKVNMELARDLLELKEIDENSCSCVDKSKSKHCNSFQYFNNEPIEGSIYQLPGIRKEKIKKIRDLGITKIKDLNPEINLTENQENLFLASLQEKPVINYENLKSDLDSLTFPLYFFDFETVSCAVPRVLDTRPWQQVPFQFSLHILHEDGSLEHKESILSSLDGTLIIARDMKNYIGTEGSIIAWHDSFEKTRIKEIINQINNPYKEDLIDIHNRFVDLKKIYMRGYIDKDFGGSFSIKKVLPVICPNLSYKDLDVQDGTQAMERWLTMIEEKDEKKKEEIRQALLEYCKLDTLAMVELYKFIKELSDKNKVV